MCFIIITWDNTHNLIRLSYPFKSSFFLLKKLTYIPCMNTPLYYYDIVNTLYHGARYATPFYLINDITPCIIVLFVYNNEDTYHVDIGLL